MDKNIVLSQTHMQMICDVPVLFGKMAFHFIIETLCKQITEILLSVPIYLKLLGQITYRNLPFKNII